MRHAQKNYLTPVGHLISLIQPHAVLEPFQPMGRERERDGGRHQKRSWLDHLWVDVKRIPTCQLVLW